jgi:hypothetical protein
MADPTGKFINVGTAAAPLNVFMPDGTWRRLDGTTDATLRMRMPDATWKTVIG